MNANQVLQQRKLERIKKQRIHESQLKRKYSQKKKYLEEELQSKLENDIMGNKKVQFYETIFKENNQEDQNNNDEKKEIQKPQINQQQQKKHNKSRKEKKQMKQVFTKKNSRGQPLMKNYLNILVKKIEKEKLEKKKNQK